MKRRYLPTLDGWRAVAITAVILCHAFSLAVPGRLNPLVLSLGQQGVSLFFAISGFLITTLLLDESERGGISLGGFYLRRVFRILPPAYLYLAALGILGVIGYIQVGTDEILASALMYNNYWPLRHWFTVHFWSLSIEEHFYLLWPFTLAVAGVARSTWIAAAGIAMTLVWRVWSVQHIHLDVTALQRTDMRLDAFLWACLLAILIHKPGRIRDVIATKRFHLLAIAILAVVYALALAHPMQLTKLAWQSALMPLVLVPTVFLPDYWITRVLECAPLRWVGRISYGLYLWQQLFFHGDAPNYRTAGLWFSPKLAGLLLLTSASYYLIERPLIRYGVKLRSPVELAKPRDEVAV